MASAIFSSNAFLSSVIGFTANPSIPNTATGFVTWLTSSRYHPPMRNFDESIMKIYSIAICILAPGVLMIIPSDFVRDYSSWITLGLLYLSATKFLKSYDTNNAAILWHLFGTSFISLMAPRQITPQFALFCARQGIEFWINQLLKSKNWLGAKAFRIATHIMDCLFAYTTLKSSWFPLWAGLGLYFLDQESFWNIISSLVAIQTPGWIANTLFSSTPLANWVGNYPYLPLFSLTAFRCILSLKEVPQTSLSLLLSRRTPTPLQSQTANI